MWEKKRVRNLIKLNYLLKNLILKIIWSYKHACHVIKTVFQMILQKKFSRNFQNFCSLNLDQSSLFVDLSKCEGEKLDFLFKVLGCPNSCSIPRDRSSLFSCCFRFLFDSSWLIGFRNSETYRNQIWLFQKYFLSISSIPHSNFFFFVFFMVKVSKFFFIYIWQDLYTLSFSSYYMFSCIFH